MVIRGVATNNGGYMRYLFNAATSIRSHFLVVLRYTVSILHLPPKLSAPAAPALRAGMLHLPLKKDTLIQH